MTEGFEITSQNASALFTLKLHRGDGMVLIGMNWKEDKPPLDFVGFAIEFKEPNSDRFLVLSNRIGFRDAGGQRPPKRDVDQALADPEIPVGAFSLQCRSRRRIRLQGYPRFHG